MSRGVVTRMSVGATRVSNPIWTPDGHEVAFGAFARGRLYNVYSVPSNDTREPARVLPESAAVSGRGWRLESNGRFERDLGSTGLDLRLMLGNEISDHRALSPNLRACASGEEAKSLHIFRHDNGLPRPQSQMGRGAFPFATASWAIAARLVDR